MKSANEASYIHGEFGKGMWTFYGGHDPEDYEHHVEEPPTDLSLHPNSVGYRLILNNVLFPAAKEKKQENLEFVCQSTFWGSPKSSGLIRKAYIFVFSARCLISASELPET